MTSKQKLASMRSQKAQQSRDVYGTYRVHVRKCKCDPSTGKYKWLPHGKSYVTRRKIKTEEKEFYWPNTKERRWDIYDLRTTTGI